MTMRLYVQDPIPDSLSHELLMLCFAPGVKATLTNDLVPRFCCDGLCRMDRLGIHVEVIALTDEGQLAIDAFANAHAA